MYEVHVGEVTNVNDDEKRGRLMVKFDNILDGVEYPDWVEPCFPFAGKGAGLFVVPPVGTAVECELHKGAGGDDSIDTPRIRWRAALYNSVDAIPEEFKDHYPKAIGLKSVGGHLLMLDDYDGAEVVLLRHGKKQESYVVIDENGSIAVQVGSSIGLYIDAQTKQIKLVGTSQVQIASTGAIDISAPSITISGRPVLPIGPPI